MTFIVVLVALLVERFFDWGHLRQWGWYAKCENIAIQKMKGASPYLVLAAAILPLMAALAIINLALCNVLYGLLALILQLFVLLYCFGPQNLWADAFAALNAVIKGDAQTAADKLKSTFHIEANQSADALHHDVVNHIFVSANRRIFAVLFWYGVLGLSGALMYRLVCVSAKNSVSKEMEMAAGQIQAILDWVPARIITFLFALGGNFTRVLSCWNKHVTQGLDSSDLMVADCGFAGITAETEKLPQDGSLEKRALALLDRTFLITLGGVLVLVILL